MQLPLLIREMIDYYRYTLPHKEKLKKLNQDYNENVSIEENNTMITRRNIKWKKTGIPIIILSGPHFKKINYYSFLNINKWNSIPSKYYHYSSGLNNPNGYK